MVRSAYLMALLLAGCAASPERLQEASNTSVCRSYGIYSRGIGWGAAAESYRAEIERRKLISEEDWALAKSGRIRNGMSQCAMYAALGGPDRENRTVYSGGVRTQHVYNAGLRYIKANYVYTENGKVVAWQD